MITLTKDANVYTMIVYFEMEPAHQQEQINAIVEFVESVVKHQSGFLSATLHKSTDGARIVNDAQWESKAAWQAAFESPAVKAYSKSLRNQMAMPTRSITSRIVLRARRPFMPASTP